MASTTAWTNDPRAVRRRNHRLSIAAVTVAFVITAAALLASVDALTWGGSAPPPGGLAAAAAADRLDDQEAGEADGADGPDDGAPAEDAVDADVVFDAVPGRDDPALTPAVSPEDPAPQPDPAPSRSTTSTTEPEPSDDAAVGGSDDDADTRGDEADAPSPTEPSSSGEDEDTAPSLGVAEVQQKLRDARFLIGPADGTAGKQTTAAIMAFQRVNGLQVDGVVGPATTEALLEGSATPSLVGGPADRIEVDLDAQLLHLVEGGERVVTLQVSSGNGESYTSGAGTARARTPVGRFVVERRIHGVRNAPLGTLYDPLYFHRGFAIHGSPSVPPYPASHGCVRVTIADAAWLIGRIPDGMPVHLYGGTHVFTP